MANICPTHGKVKHESEEDAEDALRKMKKRYPGYTGEPYLCIYCESWHLGRKRDKPRRKRRKRT